MSSPKFSACTHSRKMCKDKWHQLCNHQHQNTEGNSKHRLYHRKSPTGNCLILSLSTPLDY